MSLGLSAQSTSSIAAPIFGRVIQVDSSGGFSVTIEMPDQDWDVMPVRTEGGKRYFVAKLFLNNTQLASREIACYGSATVYFTYKSSAPAFLYAQTITADSASDKKDCPTVIQYLPNGYILFVNNCESVTVSDCIFEGDGGGISVSNSKLLLSECEIILSGQGSFINKDSGSTVVESNVTKKRI